MQAIQFDSHGTTAEGQEIARRESVSDAPFLSGAWWIAFHDQETREGIPPTEEELAAGALPLATIVCKVMSVHKSHNGSYIAVELIGYRGSPSSLELANSQGEVDEHEVVRLGNLAGFNLARRKSLEKQDNKFFVVDDVLKITCTGVTKATKEGYSDSPNFAISVGYAPSRKLKGGKF